MQLPIPALTTVRLLLLLLIVLLLAAGCIVSETVYNSAPEIRGIILDDPSVQVNQAVFVTAIATDEDGDAITYNWSASEGRILTIGPSDGPPIFGPTTNPARWRAPATPGTYTITCTANDGMDTSSFSISVTVNL